MWDGPLEKIDQYRFRIPKTYQPGMLVDGIIYASETLLPSIKKDKAPEQVANVACLPGIVNYALAMPDIHWGYGFPIGGVAATDIEAGGVISPGGVGYDINCLAPNTDILNELGYKLKIRDYQSIFNREKIVSLDFTYNKESITSILAFLKQKPKKKVYKINVSSGREIIATWDHPFFTKDGMKEISKINIGDELAIFPFTGVDYQQPSSEIIVDQVKIEEFLYKLGKNNRGNSINQILNYLRKSNFLSIKYDSSFFPFLIKMMGYCFGDGTIYFVNGRGKGVVCFYGQKEDLMDIKRDLLNIGIDGGQIYSRHRKHKIKTFYSVCKFESPEFTLKVQSTSLAVLLATLGCPIGNKCHSQYRVPLWLFKAPLWQKRLFLASLFGAELSSPKTITNGPCNFYSPTLSMNKLDIYKKNGEDFLKDIACLLADFGITTKEISCREEFVNKDNKISLRLRLLMSSDNQNLIKLYSRISFEYNKKRKFLANCAAQYLTLKSNFIQERELVACQAKNLYEEGLPPRDIFNKFSSLPWINERSITRSIYEGRLTFSRVGTNFISFNDFIEKTTQGLGTSGMVWDNIESITELEDFNDYVFDFTVANPHHNFIANNFVVSNCGVRLMKTDLQFEEVKDKISALANSLYSNIPSGVGSKGNIRVSANEVKKILLEGSAWAVARGLGVKEDLECCEEFGAIEAADPDNVSSRAYQRGQPQAGTLGSGNHFIEVQVVDTILDKDIAAFLGIDIGNITVMIHSGSRGLGYQVCDDYLRVMIKCLSKYGIDLPDRQLACAPFNSPEAKSYFGAMSAAANYAWANRQVLMHLVRKSFEDLFAKSWQSLGMKLIYDVAHNIAKLEKHKINGKEKLLCVHRKGATRAFGPENPALPDCYKKIGQPVIIPGDMATGSYLLVGTKQAEEETFGTTCHGAGRMKSRSEAIRTVDFNQLIKDLKAKGIEVRATGKDTIIEEAPTAYKNIDDVVKVVDQAGLAKKVCRMRPLCVLKG